MTYLAVNAGIIAVLAAALCLLAVRTGDPSFIDPCWGFGFVVLAWATLVQSDTPSWLLAALTSAWGLRLGGYLLWRWRREGPDKRYEGRSPIAVFATQAVLMLIIALPIELGQQRPVQFNALTVAGVAVVLVGLFFEWTGDFQLTRFRSDPSNKGKVMDRGLWHYTRHPNYFGDFCVWWGLFLISASPVAIIGPIVMSVFLLRVSGVSLTEKHLHESKPKYKDYVATTSAFFPLPPRRK